MTLLQLRGEGERNRGILDGPRLEEVVEYTHVRDEHMRWNREVKEDKRRVHRNKNEQYRDQSNKTVQNSKIQVEADRETGESRSEHETMTTRK